MADIVNLPTYLLRTFLAIVDSGGFARAAESVNRTQAAISLQIRNLEQILDCQLFRREGRQMTLTDTGWALVPHARNVIKATDEALTALAKDHPRGLVRLGMLQDIADSRLMGVLGQFNRNYPAAMLKIEVGHMQDLAEGLEKKTLDIVVGMKQSGKRSAIAVIDMPLIWIGDESMNIPETLPIVLGERQCFFTGIATKSLTKARRPHQLVMHCPSLSAIREAVQNGLGITCRTRLALRAGLRPISEAAGLPSLPAITIALYRSKEKMNPAAQKLYEILEQQLPGILS